MKIKFTTQMDEAINSLIPISTVSLNKKVLFFLEEGYQPDDLGYLQKNNKYVKILENGVSIVDKSAVWKDGIVIDKNINLLHVDG